MRIDTATESAAFRVLVVDDHPANRLLAVTVFEALGCQVWTAVDGVEAIDIANLMRFDLVLMDRHMPRCGGDRATRRIRASRGLSSDAVILAHSSDPPMGAEAALYDGVMDKPVQPGAAEDAVWSTVARTYGALAVA